MEKISEKLKHKAGLDSRELFSSLMEAAKGEKPYWGEKTPEHILTLKQLSHLYPGSFILHLKRNPRQVIASLYARSPAGGLISFIKSMARWKYSIRHRLEFEEEKGSLTIIDLAFEDLTESPREVVEDICMRLGLEFEEVMLEFQYHNTSYENDRGQKQPGGVIKKSHDKWKQIIPEKWHCLMHLFISPTAEKTGYRAEGPPGCRKSPETIMLLGISRLYYFFYSLRQDIKKAVAVSGYSAVLRGLMGRKKYA